jgi:hypothetical protein
MNARWSIIHTRRTRPTALVFNEPGALPVATGPMALVLTDACALMVDGNEMRMFKLHNNFSPRAPGAHGRWTLE